MKKSERLRILSIFLLAFILRLALMVFLRKNYFFYDYPSTDVAFYLEWAREIARHNWVGTSVFYGMPLYPYFLAILDRLTLGSLEAIRLIHLLLGSINCMFIYFIAKKIFSEKVAALSSLLVATNFTLMYYDWLLMPVTLLVFFSCVIILALLSLSEQSSRKEWFLLGLMIGLTILGDGKFLIFFFLILFSMLCRYRSSPKVLLSICVPLCLGMLIMPSAVTMRNKIINDDFIFVSAHSGINFYIGNNPQATGTFENPIFLRPVHYGHIDDPRNIAESTLQRKLSPSEVSRFWQQKALTFIRQSPIKYVQLLKDKCGFFFINDENTYDMDLLFLKEWKNGLDVNGLRLIWPLTLLGLVIASQHHRRATMGMKILIISQFLFSIIFFVINRHRATILPFLIIFESFAFFWLVNQFTLKKFKNAFMACLACLVLFFLLKPNSIDAKTVDFLRFSKSGPIYEEKNDFHKAEEQYRRALALRPTDTNTLYNLGSLLARQRQYDEAIALFKKTLQINPFHVDALYNMAYVHEMLGDVPEALNLYQAVIRFQPQSADTHLRLAELYQNQGNCERAIDHYKQIIQLKPQFENEINAIIDRCTKSLQK